VTANGSESFSPRDVQVRVQVTGDVATATLNGVDLMQNGGITTIIVGTDDMVRTFEHQDDPTNFTEETRAVLTYQNTDV